MSKEIKSEIDATQLADVNNKLYDEVMQLERFKIYAEQLIKKIHKNSCLPIPQSITANKDFNIKYGSILSSVSFYLEQFESQQNQHKDNGKA
jgi:hypothetical protein